MVPDTEREQLANLARMIPHHPDWEVITHTASITFFMDNGSDKSINIWFYLDEGYFAAGYWAGANYRGTDTNELRARVMLLQSREEVIWDAP